MNDDTMNNERKVCVRVAKKTGHMTAGTRVRYREREREKLFITFLGVFFSATVAQRMLIDLIIL